MSSSVVLIVGAAILPWLLLLFQRPPLLATLALVAILYTRTLSHLFSSSLSSLDDFATALVVACGIYVRLGAPAGTRRRYPGGWFFALFAAFGIVSGVWAHVPANVLTNASWLALKGVLFGWAVAQMDWSAYDIRRLARIGAYNVAFCSACLLVNLAAPGMWARVFSVNGGQIERFGVPSLFGPFIHPFDLAFISAFSFVALLAWRQHVEKSRYSALLMAGAGLGVVGSFRRKDLIGLLIATATFRLREAQWGRLVVSLLVAAVAVVAAWGPLSSQISEFKDSYLSANSKEARTVLTVKSWDVAQRHAPLGAGFGRYGSRQAAETYSPEYVALGFQYIYGLGPGDEGQFLTDTGWPAIIGEAGFVGFAAFILALLSQLRYIVRIRRVAESPELRWLAATALGWFVIYIIESLGASVFTSPPMFPFYFGLIGIVVATVSRTTTADAGRPIPVTNGRALWS